MTDIIVKSSSQVSIQSSLSTKIRPQAKIDNFAFNSSNIIIEGLIQKRKDYFSLKKFEMQKIMYLINCYVC